MILVVPIVIYLFFIWNPDLCLQRQNVYGSSQICIYKKITRLVPPIVRIAQTAAVTYAKHPTALNATLPWHYQRFDSLAHIFVGKAT